MIPVVLVQDEVDVKEREAYIRRLINKSGLLPQHLKMLKEEKDSQSWTHETVKLKRMMIGRQLIYFFLQDFALNQPPKELISRNT
jgi:hypothetical protein